MTHITKESLIEIGVIVAGPLDDVDRQAATVAIEQAREFLSNTLPEFQFKLLLSRRPELASEGRAQPSLLLLQAAEDRDSRHWDFVLLLTASELVGNYSPYCFAALSRPLDAAVISMSLIDPHTTNERVETADRIQRIARRSSRLMLHALGHLTGLSPHADPSNLLYHPATTDEIDDMNTLGEKQIRSMRVAVAEIADQRLEEAVGHRANRLLFWARAAWINRREIRLAVCGARPWQFPQRLSRLTIASVSTVAILFLTAESWDLALSQPAMRVAGLTGMGLVLTTLYVVVRQQLLVRRGRRYSEQMVVTSASALAIVFVGMTVTWLALLLIGVIFSWLLFNPDLIVTWAASSHLDPTDVDFNTTFHMSCFSASLGLVIGALGASFESQHYFRHIIFVDEEI